MSGLQQGTAVNNFSHSSITKRDIAKFATFCCYAWLVLTTGLLGGLWTSALLNDAFSTGPLPTYRVQGKTLAPPPASFLQTKQTWQHPHRWHVATTNRWMNSPWVPWLATYVQKNAEDNTPAIPSSFTSTRQQQVAALRQATRSIQHSRTQDILSVQAFSYIFAGNIVIGLFIMLLWWRDGRRRRTDANN